MSHGKFSSGGQNIKFFAGPRGADIAQTNFLHRKRPKRDRNPERTLKTLISCILFRCRKNARKEPSPTKHNEKKRGNRDATNEQRAVEANKEGEETTTQIPRTRARKLKCNMYIITRFWTSIHFFNTNTLRTFSPTKIYTPRPCRKYPRRGHQLPTKSEGSKTGE